MIKTRVRSYPDKNYWAVFSEGTTVRFTFDDSKPILDLDYPEFYDFKITNFCGGKCPWCYMSSSHAEEHYPDIVKKFEKFFTPMSMNQRPFQIAFGGGNPNEHPEFCRLMEVSCNLGILPNYTTNGMGVTEEVTRATWNYCGGVAMSTHEHLEEAWRRAVGEFLKPSWTIGKMGMPYRERPPYKVNLHHIVSDKASVQRMMAIYQEFQDKIDYMVVLPMVAQGRAEKSFSEPDFLFSALRKLPSLEKFAFGAKLYPHLLEEHNKGRSLPVALYEPEIMSKFVDMRDMKQYGSSFDLQEA